MDDSRGWTFLAQSRRSIRLGCQARLRFLFSFLSGLCWLTSGLSKVPSVCLFLEGLPPYRSGQRANEFHKHDAMSSRTVGWQAAPAVSKPHGDGQRGQWQALGAFGNATRPVSGRYTRASTRRKGRCLTLRLFNWTFCPARQIKESRLLTRLLPAEN